MYRFQSPVGTFTIRPHNNNFELWIEGTQLNSYSSAVAAADDVFMHATGYQKWDIMKETVFSPRNLSDWQTV